MGNRIAPISNMADYILGAIPKLERRTGIKFGESYIELLKDGTYITSSEKPSVALCVYKSFKKDSAVAYGHAIQTSFYNKGKDLNNDTLYADIAGDFGIDKNTFLAQIKDPMYVTQAHEEFSRASSLGVTGYPTLLIKQANGKYTKLTEGYTDYKSLDN